MKLLKYLFVLTMALFLMMPMMMYAVQKRALLIGLSNYSKEYSWSKINGTNDIDLIKRGLKGFKITELRNAQATHDAIINAINALIHQTKGGDIVYLHFSGHGQPVEDIDGDEGDGWDESFVPYDAGQIYGYKGYKGDKHLLDDQLNLYIQRLRQKAGNRGFVYIVIDACHSGTMDRGDETDSSDFDVAPIRGTNQGFSASKFYRPKKDLKPISHYNLQSDKSLADIIILEACGPNQKNQEIKVDGKFYGPLSYSVFQMLNTQGLIGSKKWYESVRKNMNRLLQKSLSNQQMVVETSL